PAAASLVDRRLAGAAEQSPARPGGHGRDVRSPRRRPPRSRSRNSLRVARRADRRHAPRGGGGMMRVLIITPERDADWMAVIDGRDRDVAIESLRNTSDDADLIVFDREAFVHVAMPFESAPVIVVADEYAPGETNELL